MKQFRAILFDVDGTLAETEELHRRAFNETFAYFGIDWAWDVSTYHRLLRVAGGKERIRHFCRTHRAAFDFTDGQIAELHRFKNARYLRLMDDGLCELRPGVKEFIHAAMDRGQQLAIVTTTSRGNVDAILNANLGQAWREMFEAVVAGEDVDRKKPAPDAYLKALQFLELEGRDCLAVEDSRNGLVAARDAGIAVLITRSAYFHDDDFGGAYRIVDDLTEMQQFEPDLHSL